MSGLGLVSTGGRSESPSAIAEEQGVLSIALSIIVIRAAWGIGDALRIGLRFHLLRLMKVDKLGPGGESNA